MKRLAIIVVNYNGWKDTRECLSSLAKVNSTKAKVEVILVDNASARSIAEPVNRIRSNYKKLSLTTIQNSENYGFAGANNIGIKHALEHNADFVMLLNNDTIVHPDFIDPLLKCFEKNPNAGIVGPKIYFEKGYEYHKDRYKESEKGSIIWYAGGVIDWDNIFASHRGVDEVDIGRYNRSVKTQFVTGCCMVISKEMIEKTGNLDEKYFMYLEDVDYCMRAKENGFELWFVPFSVIWHKNAQSSGESGSDLHIYYQTRNRLLFSMKYARFRTKLAVLKNSIHVVKTNTKRRPAVIDFYLRRFGKRRK